MVWGWLGIPFDEEETRQALRLMKRFHLALRDVLDRHNDDMTAASTDLSADDASLFPVPGSDSYKGWLNLVVRGEFYD